MSTTVIVKNNTVSTQWLSDFGLAIAFGGQITLNETESLDAIYGSKNLKDMVSLGYVVINNGSQDLSTSDGLLYLDFTTDYELKSAALSGVDLTYLEEGIQGNTDNIEALSGDVDINTINIEALSAVDHTDYVTDDEIAMIIALGGM